MSVYSRERAYDRIAALAGEGLDLVSLWRESAEIIQPVVPHYLAPCWFTLDPASLLITSHFNEYMPVPAAGLADARVRRRRRQPARRRRPLPERRVDAARGDARRPELEPALAGQHRSSAQTRS